jgi:hypothetical protein
MGTDIDSLRLAPPVGPGRCAGMRMDGGLCHNPPEVRATVSYCWCCGAEDAWCRQCEDPERHLVPLCRPCAEVVRGWPGL